MGVGVSYEQGTPVSIPAGPPVQILQRKRNQHACIVSIRVLLLVLPNRPLAATGLIFFQISVRDSGWNPQQWIRFLPESFR